MDIVSPGTPAEMADALRTAADAGRTIRLGGSFSKDAMGGPVVEADTTISSSALTRVLQYEPRDLTISVEAGMRWSDLTERLAADGQMIPLDPPFMTAGATVGGVLSANTSGPRRRLYGSVRDHVIGMEFATLEGKLVQSGGMVVKNVAGLDMAKLMIGSFGTLSAITKANFKLTPIPEASGTWVFTFESPKDAAAAAATLRKGVLQPAAMDILNPAASDRVGIRGWSLLVQAGGVPSVLARYDRELTGAVRLSEADASRLWTAVREFIPQFLAEHREGSVLRISTPLKGIAEALQRCPDGEVLCRAGSGVTWVCAGLGVPLKVSEDAVLEFAPPSQRGSATQWEPGKSAFRVMKDLKALFDPKGLLNPGRLYGRI